MKLVLTFARRNNHLINYEGDKKLPTTYTPMTVVGLNRNYLLKNICRF